MRVIELGATPDIKDPSRNMNMASMYDHLIWNSVKTRPNTGWNAQAVNRYDEPYHPISGVLWNSAVMYGIACGS